jgi:hypothetical protein
MYIYICEQLFSKTHGILATQDRNVFDMGGATRSHRDWLLAPPFMSNFWLKGSKGEFE